MKEFNGTVVIIDPEKFAKEEDLGKKIDTTLTRISPKLGFHTLFFTELGYQRYYMIQYKVDDIKEYYQNGTESWVKNAINEAFSGKSPKTFPIGRTSIDSGSVGVFLLSDIERYNKDALTKLKEGKDYILLKNYKGKIGYTRDKYGIVHFYGTGNNNFYTL